MKRPKQKISIPIRGGARERARRASGAPVLSFVFESFESKLGSKVGFGILQSLVTNGDSPHSTPFKS